MTELKAMYKLTELATVLGLDRETLDSLLETACVEKIRITRYEGSKGHWGVLLSELLEKIPGLDRTIAYLEAVKGGNIDLEQRIVELEQRADGIDTRVDKVYERLTKRGL